MARVYGVDRQELETMRAISAKLMEERETPAVIRERVAKYFQAQGRSTSASCARMLHIRLADVRAAVDQLSERGELERDGNIWECINGRDRRYAAAYSWGATDE